MSKSGHIPYRTCTGCRSVFPKSTLLRLVKAADGYIYDRNKTLPGRGIYICRNRACYLLAIKKKRLSENIQDKDELMKQLEEQDD